MPVSGLTLYERPGSDHPGTRYLGKSHADQRGRYQPEHKQSDSVAFHRNSFICGVTEGILALACGVAVRDRFVFASN
jgi:hypothetical protein